MLKFLKYLFTGTKPVDTDGNELVLGKAEEDFGYFNVGPTTSLTFPDHAIMPTKELDFSNGDGGTVMKHDASKIVMPGGTGVAPADIVRDKKREQLTAAQRERKNELARKRRRAARTTELTEARASARA